MQRSREFYSLAWLYISIIESSGLLLIYTLDMKLVFTKTRILTVKVATLVTFLSMVKTLDQVGLSFRLFYGR